MCDCLDIPIPWSTFWILVGLTLALLLIATAHLRRNSYSIQDLFVEGDPPRASLNKHVLIGCFLLSVWLIIMRTLDSTDQIPESVDNLLLGVLGIFVIGRVAGQGIATAAGVVTRKAELKAYDSMSVEEEQAARDAERERRKTSAFK